MKLLLLTGGVEGFRESPFLFGEGGAVEDSKGRLEADGGGGLGIFENVSNRVECEGREIAKLVAQGFDKFLSRSVELCGKGFGVQPVMNGGTVNAGSAGGGGDG
jgi:hypothetical protein